MLKIESKTVTVNKNVGEVFDFLKNLDNTGKLMPKQVTNWKGTDTTASYTVQGMADLTMAISKNEPYEKIEIKSTHDKPFSFIICYLISSINNNVTEFKIDFEGDVNPLVKMMVEKPLTNLFNYMADQLPKQFV